jgi:hypothetical protein
MSRESRSTAGVITTSPAASHFISLASCGRSAGDLVAEYLFAPGRLELLNLATLVLGGRRDPRVAVNHRFILHQQSASKSPILSGARRFVLGSGSLHELCGS